MTDERDLRPDHEMDGRVSTWLTDTDLAPDEANAGLDRLLDEFPVTPQTRRRLLGRWLDRDEGAGRRTTEHDHPLNTTRRTRLMLSATGITAALAIIALSVNVIDTSPAPPPGAVADADHTVAADGSGHFTTIGEAVAAAVDGDTIAILPGTYTEAVVVDKDLTIHGEGPRDEIVVTAPEDGPEWEVDYSWMSRSPYAIAVSGADVLLRDLTLAGLTSHLFVDNGSSVVENVLFDGIGLQYGDTGPEDTCGVVINDETTVSVSHSLFEAGAGLCVFGAATIERNELTDGASIAGVFGPGSSITANHIHGKGDLGIILLGDSAVTISDNTIADRKKAIAPGDGVSLTSESTLDIARNSIEGARLGIYIPRNVNASVVQNIVALSEIGIDLAANDSLLERNGLSRNETGIHIVSGAPTLDSNDIEGNVIGISLIGTTEPTFSSNTFCANETDVMSTRDELPDRSSDLSCDDATAE